MGQWISLVTRVDAAQILLTNFRPQHDHINLFDPRKLGGGSIIVSRVPPYGSRGNERVVRPRRKQEGGERLGWVLV